jgi:hypothetical protein
LHVCLLLLSFFSSLYGTEYEDWFSCLYFFLKMIKCENCKHQLDRY